MRRVRILFTLGAAVALGVFAFSGCGISVTVDLGSDAGGGGGVIGLDGDVPCWQTDKLCATVCTPKTEVATGCGALSCEPCNVPNATPHCDQNGVCAIASCNVGFDNCDKGQFNENATGCETNIQSDIENCGACGSDCTVNGPNWQCVFGTCCEIQCAPGTLNCNECGVDTVCETTIGTDNCGACGLKCEFANATPRCDVNAGAPTGYLCGFDCLDGYADCDGIAVNGCEVNLQTDVTKCGNCNTVCNTTNGTPSCNNGVCGIQCIVVGGVLYENCNNQTSDGCETPLNTNQNCGACGNACNATTVLNAVGPTCTPAGCGYASCQAGFDDCDGNPNNGCETPLNTSDDCGGCNVACAVPNPGGTATCQTGSCAKGCVAGYGNCDGNFNNGCEPLNTTTNCGTCAQGCSPPHSTGASCPGGTCGFTGCQGGWGDCNTGGGPNAGCEQQLNTPTHCGACNQACNPQHATGASCSSGTCTWASCAGGWDDCVAGGGANLGCETPLGTNQNCNGCGNQCMNGKTCQGGSCQCPTAKPMDCGGSCAANCCEASDCPGSGKCCVNDTCQNQPADGGACP